MTLSTLFRRQIALPAEHGSWGFFLSPLLIGLFAGGRWSTVSFYLVIAALCAFLIRHPLTLIIKGYSGRRSRDILPAAWFWVGVYGALALVHVCGLVLRGYGYILYLAIPGIPVVLWHLFLISRRAERRQLLLEVVACGALALGAPAAFWIGLERPDPIGWWLWALTWAQSTAAIVYAYLRLSQRPLARVPAWKTRLAMGRAALTLATFNLALALVLGAGGVVSRWIFVPYALQWAEVVWGSARPAVGLKPTAIGYRQLFVHTLFTVLFIIAWAS